MFRLIALLAAMLVLLAACGGDDEDPNGNGGLPLLTASSTLQEVQDRYASAESNFSTLHGKILVLTTTGQYTEEIWYRSSEGQRLFIQGDLTPLAPAYRSGDIRIMRTESGTTTAYLFQPETSRWCQAPIQSATTPLRPNSLPSDLVLTNGRIEAEEEVAGRPALKLLRDVSQPGFYVWIDAEYGIVLKQKSEATTLTTIEAAYTEIEFDVPIDDSLFEPNVPDGYTEAPCQELVTA